MTTILLRLTLLPFFALVFALGTVTAIACMYGPPYRTVCETYAEADAVVIGTIESVRSQSQRREDLPAQTVVIKVEQTFKGKTQNVIELDQPQSSCDWDFSGLEGKTLLLYLGRDRKTGSYSAFAQGMGGEIAKVSEDLLWLRGLPESLKRTWMSGEIRVYEADPFRFLRYASGVKVKIHNDSSSFEVTTDQTGVFELWDIPVGKYQVDPILPNDLTLDFNLPKGLVDFDSLRKTDSKKNDVLIEIKPGSCGGVDFVVNEKARE